MTRESTDVDTAEQVIDSFRILAADKVNLQDFFQECKILQVLEFDEIFMAYLIKNRIIFSSNLIENNNEVLDNPQKCLILDFQCHFTLL